MTKQQLFKKELKELLEKHDVRLSLTCWDMTASLCFHTRGEFETTFNEIAECEEGLYTETIVNGVL
jgi:hypothetical protein